MVALAGAEPTIFKLPMFTILVMKACKITVTGKVQKVGYRDAIEQIADELNIRGYVKNLENKDVEIVAEHEDESVLKEFIKRINISKGIIRVTNLNVEEIKPVNYEYFEVVWGEKLDEILESMVSGARHLSDISGEQVKTTSEIKGVKDEIKGVKGEIIGVKDEIKNVKSELKETRQDLKDTIITEQAKTTDEIKGVKEEIKGVKSELIAVKDEQRKTTDEIKGVREEVKGVRYDLSTFIGREFEWVKVKISGIEEEIKKVKRIVGA